MRSTLLVLLGLSTATILHGCAMPQDYQDQLGTVPDSVNYTTFSEGDRSGSAFTGTEVVETETPESTPVQPKDQPTDSDQ